MPFILFEISVHATNNDAYVVYEYIYNNSQLYIDRIYFSAAYQAMRDNRILLYTIIKNNYRKTNHLFICCFRDFAYKIRAISTGEYH